MALYCPACGSSFPNFEGVSITEKGRQLERELYELNGRIRASRGDPHSAEWRELMRQHDDLLRRYRAEGGRRL